MGFYCMHKRDGYLYPGFEVEDSEDREFNQFVVLVGDHMFLYDRKEFEAQYEIQFTIDSHVL